MIMRIQYLSAVLFAGCLMSCEHAAEDTYSLLLNTRSFTVTISAIRGSAAGMHSSKNAILVLPPAAAGSHPPYKGSFSSINHRGNYTGFLNPANAAVPRDLNGLPAPMQ